MISESSFQRHSITRALYANLIDRLYAALLPRLGDGLSFCSFGFVPDSEGRQALFIVTDSRSQVDWLAGEMRTIATEVKRLMPGVLRVVLCVEPPRSPDEAVEPTVTVAALSEKVGRSPSRAVPKFTIGKLFKVDDFLSFQDEEKG